MPIENIRNLAKPEKPFKFSFPVFKGAKEYIKKDAKTDAEVVIGFSIDFSSYKQACDFLRAMRNLSDNKGRKIFPELDRQPYNLIGIDPKTPRIPSEFTVNIECEMNDYLEQRIRRSNLAKLIERQKARQDSVAKTVFATAINVVALGGVPVLGYAANGAGRALALAEQKLGAIPFLGFALRNSSRLLLDVGAGILRHGKSFFPSTSTNRSQASALEDLSDKVGKDEANTIGNSITDVFTFGLGAALKLPAIATNFVADGLNRMADSLEIRKADESKSTFSLRKFAANAIKTMAFPLRVPEIIANWLVNSAERSIPEAHRAVDKLFRSARIEEGSVEKTQDIKDEQLPALRILNSKPGLVFNLEYSIGRGEEKYHLAQLAEVEVNGITCEVWGSYEKPPKIFYKYSERAVKEIVEFLPDGVLTKVNMQLDGIAKMKDLAAKFSPISVGGFFAKGEEVCVKTIKDALNAAIEKAKEDDAANKKALNAFKVYETDKFVITVGTQSLTCEGDVFTFSEHEKNLNMQSREFFNFLGNLSRGNAALMTYGPATLNSSSSLTPTGYVQLSGRGLGAGVASSSVV